MDHSSIFYIQLLWIFSSQNISQCTGLTVPVKYNIWFVENISYFNNSLLYSIKISLIVLKLSSSHTCTCAYSHLLFMWRQTMDDGHFSGTDFPQKDCSSAPYIVSLAKLNIWFTGYYSPIVKPTKISTIAPLNASNLHTMSSRQSTSLCLLSSR